MRNASVWFALSLIALAFILASAPAFTRGAMMGMHHGRDNGQGNGNGNDNGNGNGNGHGHKSLSPVPSLSPSPTGECPNTDEQNAKYFSIAMAYSHKSANLSNTLQFFGTYWAPNGVFANNYIGSFEGLQMSLEYCLIPFIVGGLQVGSGDVYYGSFKRTDKVNQVVFFFNNSYVSDDEYMYNLMTKVYMTFDGNCDSPLVLEAFNVEDPYAEYYFNHKVNAQFDVTQVCQLLTYVACPPGSPYQQYASFDDCVDAFTNRYNQGYQAYDACPSPITADTGSCRRLHAIVSTTDKPTSQELHCPHTGEDPSLTPCIDHCLPYCDACTILATEGSPMGYNIRNVSSNSICVANTVIDSIQFGCQCNDGTLIDNANAAHGKMNCKYLTCRTNKDCRSNKAWVSCVNNQCVPKTSFSWNASLPSYQRKEMTYCQYGADQVYTNQTSGEPLCVPKGNCIYGNRDAVKQCRSVLKDDPLEKKTVTCERMYLQDHVYSINIQRFASCMCHKNGIDYPCGYDE